MERLTSREPRVSGIPGVCCTHFTGPECQTLGGCCTEGCPWEDAAWECLAAYEDTDLTPEEIMAFAPPPNDPLTLDELREMDGEPVWIAPVKDRGKMPERWMLVADFLPESRIYLFMPDSGITQGYKETNYGKTWLAYRRRPEERVT